MYIDRFINDKYIYLFRYYKFLNSKNCIIVYLKYGKYNSEFFLRKLYKGLSLNKFKYLLLQLNKKTKVALLINTKKRILQKLRKNELIHFFLILLKARIPLKYKILISSKFIKLLKLKFKYRFKFLKKKNKRDIKKFYSFYNLINYNVNLNFFIKKIKLLKFILNKILKPQVMANAALLDGFLNLNLHSLFLRRFRFRFLKFIKKLKSTFNYNNFNYKFTSNTFKKIVNFGYLHLVLSKLKQFSIFNQLLYNNNLKKLQHLLNFDFKFKFLNKFKKYIINFKNINYIKCSFKLWVYVRKNRRKIRRKIKKFRKINFFIFLKLAILKLINFLFLYWLNNLIIVVNIKAKISILFNLYKPLKFIFKSYFWRKRKRLFYLNYNAINNFIFVNYKIRLINKLNE